MLHKQHRNIALVKMQYSSISDVVNSLECKKNYNHNCPCTKATTQILYLTYLSISGDLKMDTDHRDTQPSVSCDGVTLGSTLYPYTHAHGCGVQNVC